MVRQVEDHGLRLAEKVEAKSGDRGSFPLYEYSRNTTPGVSGANALHGYQNQLDNTHELLGQEDGSMKHSSHMPKFAYYQTCHSDLDLSNTLPGLLYRIVQGCSALHLSNSSPNLSSLLPYPQRCSCLVQQFLHRLPFFDYRLQHQAL